MVWYIDNVKLHYLIHSMPEERGNLHSKDFLLDKLNNFAYHFDTISRCWSEYIQLEQRVNEELYLRNEWLDMFLEVVWNNSWQIEYFQLLAVQKYRQHLRSDKVVLYLQLREWQRLLLNHDQWHRYQHFYKFSWDFRFGLRLMLGRLHKSHWSFLRPSIHHIYRMLSDWL